MQTGLLHTSYTERTFQKLIGLLQKYRFSIAGTLLCGLLAYTFAFTNKLVNLDDLHYLFEKGATLESGRWGLTLLSYVFPDYSMPWLYGILSLLLLAAGICLCMNMFSIQSPVLQFLLSGLLVTFPSQIATFTYTFTASAYAVSFLLSVMAAWYLCSGKKSGFLPALLCSILSSGIYQAYISITASLLVVYLIKLLLTSDLSEGKLFRKGLFYVFFLILALGLYWISAKVVWLATRTTMGAYATDALAFSLKSLLYTVKDTYVRFWGMLRFRHHLLITDRLSHVAHLLSIAIIGAELLLWVIRNKKPLRILLLCFLLGVLPVSINCMYIFIDSGMVHSLVMYAFTAIYLLAAVVLENGQHITVSKKFCSTARQISYDAILWCISAIVICNVYFANESYLNLHLKYENTYSFTTTVLSALQNSPDYTSDSKVAIVGTYTPAVYHDENFHFLDASLGLSGISPNTYSLPSMFSYYNGTDLNFAEEEECSSIAASAEFADMPAYPSHGYVKNINGIYVIKLSDLPPA